MPKEKIIFIVEGDLEKDFLQRQCSNKSVIRKIPSNGDDVAIERLVLMIVAILQAVRRYSRVFIILDREGRSTSAVDLEAQLLSGIYAKGISGEISVHIADRMIENWILADQSAIASESLTVDTPEGTEGCSGKAKLKQAFRNVSSSYSERIDGVRLLSNCDPTTIAQNSPSFARLYSELGCVANFCNWMNTS